MIKALRLYFLVFLFFGTSFIGLNHKVFSAEKYDSSKVKITVPSKIQEEKVFKEIDLSFAKKSENEDLNFWDKFKIWLNELLFGKDNDENKILLQEIVIWVLVIAGLLLIIWLLTRSEFTSFLQGNTKDSEFNFSDINEDFSEINFDERINTAITHGDFRLAIRWLYLKQLYLLNSKNLIAWEPYKTNIDYHNELTKTNLQTNFAEISKIYDFVWYGKYEVSVSNYKNIEEEFHQFAKTLSA